MLSGASRRIARVAAQIRPLSTTASNAAIEIVQFPCRSDNYGYLIHDPVTKCTATVDTPAVAPVMELCGQRGWTLTHILNTHHHDDHAGGNQELKQMTGCIVVGPRADSERIPCIDVEVGQGDRYPLGEGGAVATVFDTPGHTKGHICFHFAEHGAAFVGDTIFSMGCGRLFEGSILLFCCVLYASGSRRMYMWGVYTWKDPAVCHILLASKHT